MRTRITDLFAIKRPIIQGGVRFIELAERASALSTASGPGHALIADRWAGLLDERVEMDAA